LAAFLRAHYTTKPDTAGALAKYVMGFATLRAAPITAPSADEGGVARSGEGTRRRTSNLSGDGEKPARPRAEANRADVSSPHAPRPGLTQPGPAAEAAALPAARNARPARGRSAEGESSPANLNDYARSG